MADAYANMNADFATRLRALVAATGGKVRIVSGYRSPERQAQLFAAAVKKYGSEAAARKWVAPPGKSNHGRGLAADLAGDLGLAHRLAPKFGLTFPLSNEAWHVEPAGARSKGSNALTKGPAARTTAATKKAPQPGEVQVTAPAATAPATPTEPTEDRHSLVTQLESFVSLAVSGGFGGKP